jgi:hypothetical protein
MSRRISIEEFLNATERIDPNTEDLASQCQALTNCGASVAEAIITIADEQSTRRKPVEQQVTEMPEKRKKA